MLRKVTEVPECEGCPMRRLLPGNTFVAPKLGTGNRLTCAEAPGEVEDALGEPLVGGTGKLTDTLYARAGVTREARSLINVIQCRPHSNNFPTDSKARYYITKKDAEKAVGQCLLKHVLPFLESREWERVDLLGDKALKYIGGIDEDISTWRGSPIEVDTEDVRARALALMRQDS